jgi:hypothetical protein
MIHIGVLVGVRVIIVVIAIVSFKIRRRKFLMSLIQRDLINVNNTNGLGGE